MHERLVDRNPVVPADQLVAQLVPPAMFDEVSFASYIPDPAEPSQAAAVKAAEEFVGKVEKIRGGKRGLFGRKAPAQGAGLYLDGGFGVGKTHLLASIFHSAPSPKAFGTFVELTHVVGALGFNKAVEELSSHSVLCIDEFELDDPGDTMLISRLLTELSARGVSIVATSNTLPGQLGEGRFAAQDFLREIKKLASIFETIRVDGPDYRHRDLPPAPDPIESEELIERARPGFRRDARRLRRTVRSPEHLAPVPVRQARRRGARGLHQRSAPRARSVGRLASRGLRRSPLRREYSGDGRRRTARRDLHAGDAVAAGTARSTCVPRRVCSPCPVSRLPPADRRGSQHALHEEIVVCL